MSNRWWPSTLMRFISLFGVILLVLLSSSSDWFAINGEGKYVEGLPREPSILINYTVNSTEEQVDLEFKNYTPLRTYWRNREPVPQSQPIIEYSSEDLEDMNFQIEESKDPILDLEKSREIMAYLFISMILIQIMILLIPKMNLILPLLVWLIGLIGFLIIVPMGVISSFGFEGPTGGFSDETDDSDFVHMNVETGINVNTEGIKFTIETLGFDLGLVPLDEHDNVTEKAPKEGEKNYDSLIGFDAYLQLEFSEGLRYWSYIPILILLIYLFDRIDKKIIIKDNDKSEL